MMPTPRDEIKSRRDVRYMARSSTIDNEQLIARYIAERAHTGKRWRPETQRVRAYQLGKVAEDLAPVSLLDATEDDLLAWHARMPGRPETIAAYTSAVHGLYHWMAVKARPRLRDNDPSLILERPNIPEALPRPMLDRHFDLALACAVSDPELYLWLGLMGCSGLRCCEVAWMQVSDVEPLADSGGLLHIEGKGGKRRTVPVGEMLMLTMRPFLRGRGPVFTRPSDGQPYSPQSISTRVNGFLSDIGVPKPYTAHSLRHKFGTDYHSIDRDMYRQAKLMGHGSIDTTRRYTEVSPVEAAEYIEQLTTRRLGRRKGRAA
jgi:site-specific recombinase XerD